jgi:hypothetical protein
MTCIVGLLDKGNIYMGGDSAGVSGLSVSVRADEKVFVNGPFVMGFTTSFRMGQLLRYKFDPPKQTVGTSDMKYMVNDFIDSIRKCFEANGYGDGKNSSGGSFLVGYNGVLYVVHNDFQVGIPALPYDAVGCGEDIALGAMYASQGKKPEERIKLALEAASTFSGGVLPPFVLIKQSKNK